MSIPSYILNGIPVPEDHKQLTEEGMWSWKNPKGYCVIAIHHTADPDKRPGNPTGDAWIKEAKAATASARDWSREQDIDFTIKEGDPFFPNFNREVHVVDCPYDKRLPIARGWDFARGRPAVVWTQLGRDLKLRVLHSFMAKNMNIFNFAPLIISETNQRFPRATVTDYGDIAGAQESDKGATTMILLEQFGIEVVTRFSYLEEGLKIMEQKLMIGTDGKPNLLIDPSNTDLIDGFGGGYILDTSESGKDSEGRLKNKPKKDGYYDHLMDALRYVMLHLFTFGSIKGGRKAAPKAIGLWETNEQHDKKSTGKTGKSWEAFYA